MNTQALVIDVNVFLNAMTVDHVKQGESLDSLRRVLAAATPPPPASRWGPPSLSASSPGVT
ncbi:hypothetical protein ACMHYB_23235 [Sorangium sp. So ce1128]